MYTTRKGGREKDQGVSERRNIWTASQVGEGSHFTPRWESVLKWLSSSLGQDISLSFRQKPLVFPFAQQAALFGSVPPPLPRSGEGGQRFLLLVGGGESQGGRVDLRALRHGTGKASDRNFFFFLPHSRNVSERGDCLPGICNPDVRWGRGSRRERSQLLHSIKHKHKQNP